MLILSGVLFYLINYVESARILGVFFYPSISHQVIFQPIWRELSLRGHQVTVITPNPLNDPKLINLTEIDVSETYEILKKQSMDKLWKRNTNLFQKISGAYNILMTIEEAELNNKQFQDLLNDENKQFDLLLIEVYASILFGVSARYNNLPIIGISSLDVPINLHDIMGNPTHPVVFPDVFLSSYGKLSLWQKFESIFYSIWYRLNFKYYVLPKSDKIARKYFGNDIPYLGDIKNNLSLIIMNINHFLQPPRPLTPTTVQVTQMHIRPTKPLPSDLQKILDDSPQGVIYFSLGSNIKSNELPLQLRQAIIDELSGLPYRILWKFEDENLPNKPSNIIIRKWLPQQDVLAHPNVKAFLTQGGLQSIEESISRGVPMVGMPFMLDQPMNVKKIIDKELGLGVNPHNFVKDELKQTIIEVAENIKYCNNVKKIQALTEDMPMTGLEKSIWWIEYVLRHNGTSHIQCPLATISWLEYFLLDVIAFFCIVCFAIYYLTKTLFMILFNIKNNKIKIN